MLAEIGFCWWVSCWHKCLMKFDDIWYDWFLVSTIFVNLFAGSFGLFLIFFLNVVEHLVALRSGGSSLQIWPRPTQWSPRRGWIKGCNICGQGLLMIPLGSHGWMVGSWRMCIDGVAYEDTHTQTHTYIYKNIHMFPFQGHIISYHIIIYIYIHMVLDDMKNADIMHLKYGRITHDNRPNEGHPAFVPVLIDGPTFV